MKKDLLLLLHDEVSTTGTTAEWCELRKVSYCIENAALFSDKNQPRAGDRVPDDDPQQSARRREARASA